MTVSSIILYFFTGREGGEEEEEEETDEQFVLQSSLPPPPTPYRSQNMAVLVGRQKSESQNRSLITVPNIYFFPLSLGII